MENGAVNLKIFLNVKLVSKINEQNAYLSTIRDIVWRAQLIEEITSLAKKRRIDRFQGIRSYFGRSHPHSHRGNF